MSRPGRIFVATRYKWPAMERRHGTENEECHRDGSGSELGPSLGVCVHVNLYAEVAFLDAGQHEGKRRLAV